MILAAAMIVLTAGCEKKGNESVPESSSAVSSATLETTAVSETETVKTVMATEPEKQINYVQDLNAFVYFQDSGEIKNETDDNGVGYFWQFIYSSAVNEKMIKEYADLLCDKYGFEKIKEENKDDLMYYLKYKEAGTKPFSWAKTDGIDLLVSLTPGKYAIVYFSDGLEYSDCKERTSYSLEVKETETAAPVTIPYEEEHYAPSPLYEDEEYYDYDGGQDTYEEEYEEYGEDDDHGGYDPGYWDWNNDDDNGITKIKCWKCHGDGTIACTQCDGFGKTYSYIQTPNYAGDLTPNNGSAVGSTCMKCHGSGSITCPNCGGTGKT